MIDERNVVYSMACDSCQGRITVTIHNPVSEVEELRIRLQEDGWHLQDRKSSLQPHDLTGLDIHAYCNDCMDIYETLSGAMVQENPTQVQVLTTRYPRAMKLILAGKDFVVVSAEEMYFRTVYETIRQSEQHKGTWTEEDEKRFTLSLVNSIRIRSQD